MGDTLSPFDTGDTAEPVIWASDKTDHIGKVDFDDSEGASVLTVQVTKDPHGGWNLNIDLHSDDVALYIS